MGSAAGFVGRDVIFIASVGLGIARAIQAPAQQAIVPARWWDRAISRARWR